MAASPPAAPGRIFISYRREETAYPAGWLYDRLADRFGRGQIFKDVDSIQLGDDFAEVITTAVGSCDVLLALIGDRWLKITDDHGRRRLDNREDFVRLEIEAALARKVLVIPILVDGASMPRADELPTSLVKLVRRQALELSPSRFDFDTSRLLKVLDKTLTDLQAGPAAKKPDVGNFVPPAAVATPGRPSPSEWGKPSGERPRVTRRDRKVLVIIAGVVGLVVATIVIANVTPPIPPTPLPTGTVTFRDDFSRALYGWVEVGPKRVGGHYVGGTYRIRSEPNGPWWSWPPGARSVYPSAGPNLRIDVKGRAVTGSDQGGYGILCRTNGTNSYEFEVDDNGTRILKVSDSQYTQLASADTSVVKHAAANLIQASCTSARGQESVRLQLWVNGQTVNEATDTDHPLQTGTVGLFAACYREARKPIEAQFDNFVVMKIR